MAGNFDPKSEEGINDINITPFVDVVLVLLVIFMVTAPMLAKEAIEIRLPKASSADRTEPVRMGIVVTKEGQILVNGELVTLQGLEAVATLEYQKNSAVEVLISADQQSSHGDVVSVLDAVKKVGIENFAFQIERVVQEQ